MSLLDGGFDKPMAHRRAARWIRAASLHALLVALLTALCSHNHVAAQQGTGAPEPSDDQRLEQYLERLGLVQLQMLHLEQQLDVSAPNAVRTATARRLADLYAEQLMEQIDDSGSYQETVTRIDRLLALVPQAKTASLEVMLLQADYQRAEALIAQARVDDDPAKARGQALAILERIAPVLAQRQQELWQAVDSRSAQLENVANNASLEQQERELRRQQIVASRASYFAGWACYYWGVLPTPRTTEPLQQARSVFRRVLDIGQDESYAELDADSLELGSSWRARAMIGLGLCEAALSNIAACHECFRLVESEATPREIRDEAEFWHLQALLNAAHIPEALELARERIGRWPTSPTKGRVAFSTALIRAAYEDRHLVPGRQDFADLGMQGLVRLRQFQLLSRTIARYAPPLDENAQGLVGRWLFAQQIRQAADESHKSEDYQRAADVLTAALREGASEKDLILLNLCRMELAWCYYQLENWSLAAGLYRQAAEGLRAAKADEAVDAGWMALVALHRKTQNDESPQLAPLVEGLEWLRREFPMHAHTKRAEFLLQKLQLRSADPQQLEASLAAVPPGDPNYVNARLELCRVLYERFRQSPDTKDQAADEAPDAMALLRKTAEQLLTMPAIRLDDGQRLELRLMLASVALEMQPPDAAEARAQLQQVNSVVKKLDAESTDQRVAQYHYQCLQVARLLDNQSEIGPHAEWFIEHGQGTPWELAGLVAAAMQIDERYAKAADEQRTTLAEKGLRVYERLSSRLGEDPQTLASQRNAQVAMSRRAQYAGDLGRWSEAATSLDRLLAAFPKERHYLRRAGLATIQLGQWERSLEYWRTLLAGSKAGTAEWYEAKYHQLTCLLETDRRAAAQVFRQFQLLDPELGKPPWREKFQQLQSRL